MKESLPHFEKIGTAMGGVVYRTSLDGAFAFVYLVVSPKVDRFTVEVATAPSPDYPFDLLPGDPSHVSVKGATRARIRKLVGQEADWWQINDTDIPDLEAILSSESRVSEDIRKIPELARDAVAKVAQCLPTYLVSLGRRLHH